MSALDRTAFDAFLKTAYAPGVPTNLAKRKKVGLSLFAQKDDLDGDGLKIPLQIGNIAGRSASVTNLFDAGTQNGPATRKAFTITAASDYANIVIDNQLMMASRKDRGAFAQARKSEIDSMIDELGRSLEIDLWRSGTGALGRRLSINSNTITLHEAKDAKNFHVGQVLAFSTADGGGSVKAGTTHVTSVDESAGTITVDDITDITGPANDDYIFVAGDYDSKVKGVGAWIPLTAPGSTPFFGVDRTADLARLSGHRLAAGTNSVEEQIMELAESIGDMGGSPDRCFISSRHWNTLAKSLGSRIEYDGGGGTATMGFEHIKIATSCGVLKVTPVPYMPQDRGYILQMDTWCLHHLGEIPHLSDEDGKMAQRARLSDGTEVRAKYYAQLACNAPGFNGVFGL